MPATSEIRPPEETRVRIDDDKTIVFQLTYNFEIEPKSIVSTAMLRSYFADVIDHPERIEEFPWDRIPKSKLATDDDLREEWDRPEEDEACPRSSPET